MLGNSTTSQNNGNKESALTVPKEEPSTLFQRQRVDMLLAELVRQFPLPATTQPDTKPVIIFILTSLKSFIFLKFHLFSG